jgi:hypothetical protein
VYFIVRRTQAERSVVFLHSLERSFRAEISAARGRTATFNRIFIERQTKARSVAGETGKRACVRRARMRAGIKTASRLR